MSPPLLLFAFLFPTIAIFAQPTPPTHLVTRSGDRSVILHAEPPEETQIKGYRFFRSMDEAGPFVEPVPAVFRFPHFVDFNVENDQVYYYRVRTVDTSDLESADSETIAAFPSEPDDAAFTELVQQTAFDYFWYEANPSNGLIRDRNTDGSASSIAAVGFGLSALTVGIDRGWIDKERARERVLTTLEFFWSSPHGPESDATGYKGFYYHFLNMESGRRAGTSELSTIDTALLLAGVLHVGQYFDGENEVETQIRSLADSIYLRVEWDWAQPRPPRIGHGWRPESGFILFDWGGYNEAMIVYLLALGSPTHPVSPDAWDAWTNSYKWGTYYGYDFVVFPPLFGHQYTHVWFDFRNIQDAYMRSRGIDYFENSQRATLANRAYAIENPKGWGHYNENNWGLTASDVPNGYAARGAPPAQNDDGTIAPTAAAGSFPFTPDESLAALRTMYDTYRTQIWGRYGFRDAFNPARNWFARDHLGIDQGPIVLMIENHWSEAIWRVFGRSPYVQAGLERAGFTKAVAVEEEYEAYEPKGFSIYPIPSSSNAVITFEIAQPSTVELTVYDVLGREIVKVLDSHLFTGIHRHNFDVSDLPIGMYIAMLRLERSVWAKSFVVIR